ncbi:MAG: flagellar basal body rod protein FlgG, partial [Deltaproteobacteria bacterium]
MRRPAGRAQVEHDEAGTVVWTRRPVDVDLELATFPNPGGLEPMGRNLYRATTASGPVLTAAPGNEGLGTVA